MATTLEVVLLYLVAAVLGVVVCRSLKLPPMLGYLVVGVLIGPNALALAGDPADELKPFGHQLDEDGGRRHRHRRAERDRALP